MSLGLNTTGKQRKYTHHADQKYGYEPGSFNFVPHFFTHISENQCPENFRQSLFHAQLRALVKDVLGTKGYSRW